MGAVLPLVGAGRGDKREHIELTNTRTGTSILDVKALPRGDASGLRVAVKADREAQRQQWSTHDSIPISATKRLIGAPSVVSMMTFRRARVKAT